MPSPFQNLPTLDPEIVRLSTPFKPTERLELFTRLLGAEIHAPINLGDKSGDLNRDPNGSFSLAVRFHTGNFVNTYRYSATGDFQSKHTTSDREDMFPDTGDILLRQL